MQKKYPRKLDEVCGQRRSKHNRHIRIIFGDTFYSEFVRRETFIICVHACIHLRISTCVRTMQYGCTFEKTANSDYENMDILTEHVSGSQRYKMNDEPLYANCTQTGH